MTQIATRDGSTLALRSDQEFWNDKQRAALEQLGVQGASNADLAVFFHVAQRSGLDPFARQCYMIGRRDPETGQNRWTIQTGIDGFRLIADRAAVRLREKRSNADPMWCGKDMQWLPAWPFDEPPAAAKYVVYRDGEPFPAVVMYREFVQRKRDGKPTRMWRDMPANQLIKCAEAAALRKAYPQDLAGIYVDEEMGQASNPPQRDDTQRVTVAELGHADPAGGPAEVPGPPATRPRDELTATAGQVGRLIAKLRDLDVESDEDQRAWFTAELGRPVEHRHGITRGEFDRLDAVLDVLIAERGDQPGADQ
jgi:phage recombination protein Bet